MVPLQEILDQKRARLRTESTASEVIQSNKDILCLVPVEHGLPNICLLSFVWLLLILRTSHITLCGRHDSVPRPSLGGSIYTDNSEPDLHKLPHLLHPSSDLDTKNSLNHQTELQQMECQWKFNLQSHHCFHSSDCDPCSCHCVRRPLQSAASQ